MGKQRTGTTPGKRSPLLWLLAIELLCVSGPFALAVLHTQWLERRGLPPPEKFVYVPWMLAAGIALLLVFVAVDVAARLKKN